MELLIDNYDSFTYNLYQQIGQFTTEVTVKKNDELTCQQIAALRPQHIIISPGPGTPADAGICLELVRRFAGKIPILGVCMGLEVIAAAFKADIVAAQQLMHGKTDTISLCCHDRLLQGVAQHFTAARYHSLVATATSLPKNFRITGFSSDNEVMSFSDESQRLYAVQYHPESIMTDSTAGNQIISNFLRIS
ncbi:anthranilate synthase, component II [Liquorilactobacillus ghanensis DSM 18630]|uniref:Anthranilate synthase, component II n=1 Tax=Liquorilactobacillus ghanensis DSM 18630 TaxID=1423750 RepID=A0A0R1VGS4_9LACO|nr:aminodeoxychorismate/anthranilate synthase component II [Liquorilactobacillus ghanensis]KRM04509.1 anthranilate synthase, component II [Liquorilactobacillus ghanensis DSM 18630]